MARQYNEGMSTILRRQAGAISGATIAIIGISIAAAAFAGLAVWAFVNYSDQKNNVDTKIALAEAEAKKKQAEEDEAKFAEREKEPNRDFVGPDDYGRLTFKYPKTWSVYIAKDTSGGGTYEAYLNPVTVPPVSAKQQYAVRVLIEEKDYDEVLGAYEQEVKKGDLKTTAFSAKGHSGTRLDGAFSKDIRGSAVVLKLRDKTITLRSDADTFKPDFDKLIQTIDFNS